MKEEAQQAGPPPTGVKPLEMWAVYDHPADYPNHFVARRFLIGVGGTAIVETEHVLMARTLEKLRQGLEALGLAQISRSDSDEPHIVETWL